MIITQILQTTRSLKIHREAHAQLEKFYNQPMAFFRITKSDICFLVFWFVCFCVFVCLLIEAIKSIQPNFGRLSQRVWHELSIGWIKPHFSRAGYYFASSYVNINPATDATSCFLSISINSSCVPHQVPNDNPGVFASSWNAPSSPVLK